jgi:FMN reductase (NADPH)
METNRAAERNTPNETIRLMLRHASIRHFRQDELDDDIIEIIARAGRQAAFASQLYSVLLTRDRARIPYGAPALFTICVDTHKLEVVMARRGWSLVTNDLSLLLFGIQDAALMAQNMVLAAESLGLGTCFLGGAPYNAEKIREDYKLPKRVFPLVQLVMGYPAEDPPPRPRYPLDFVLFEDEYPEFRDVDVAEAMRAMDEGYQAQDYYRVHNAMIELERGKKETFTYDDYGWTEHISRKWGQWFDDPAVVLEPLARCGFHIAQSSEENS